MLQVIYLQSKPANDLHARTMGMGNRCGICGMRKVTISLGIQARPVPPSLWRKTRILGHPCHLSLLVKNARVRQALPEDGGLGRKTNPKDRSQEMLPLLPKLPNLHFLDSF